MSRTYLQEGDTVELVASYSEAACQTRIAGKRVIVSLHRWRDGELYAPAGSPAGYGLTLSEIGFYRDDTGWYVPEEHAAPKRPIKEALAEHTGVIVLGPLSPGVGMRVGEAALYVNGECVERARQHVEHANDERATTWSLTFHHPNGRPKDSRVFGAPYGCVVGALQKRLVQVHGGRHSEIGIHLADEVAW